MSVAFYPSKGLVCFGSELAAVKGGLSHHFPGTDVESLGRSKGDMDDDVLRLDLDDLSGEICLLDWGGLTKKCTMPSISEPNRELKPYSLMNGGIDVILCQENKATAIQYSQLYHRMTCLTRNRFVKSLPPMTQDPVLADIMDIPMICSNIQDEWKADKASSSLNRLTAFNLSRCLRTRLDKIIRGSRFPGEIDLLLTGCEVSLWLAEQFASGSCGPRFHAIVRCTCEKGIRPRTFFSLALLSCACPTHSRPSESISSTTHQSNIFKQNTRHVWPRYCHPRTGLQGFAANTAPKRRNRNYS